MSRKITLPEELLEDSGELNLEHVGTAGLVGEVITAEALSKFPSLDGLSPRDMLVIMAVAHNFSYRAITDATGIPPATVGRIVNRIDPCGRYRLDRDSMKAFIAQRARAKTAEVLGVIDIAEVREMGPLQQGKLAKTIAETGAIQEKRDLGSMGGKGVKKITVEFVDEIDEARPIAELTETIDY